MGQICLILQGVVVGQWLLQITYCQSLLTSPGNEKQCILPLRLSFFLRQKKKGLRERGQRDTFSAIAKSIL